MTAEKLLLEAQELAAKTGATLDQVLTVYKIKEQERWNNLFSHYAEEWTETVPNSIYRIADNLKSMAS